MATNTYFLNCPPLRFPEFFAPWQKTTLGKVCTIKTGKLDANAMVEDGSYPFFTCAKQTYQTDTYSFSGEAILVAGNGEVGLTKYYNGKFNAYQRTYVLQSLSSDVILLFIRNHIDYTLPKRIISFLNGSAMPYITLSTLSDMPICLPSLEEQRKIAEFLSLIDERIETQRQTIEERKKQKKALLHQIFSQSLRFPDFFDEWTHTTLGEVAEINPPTKDVLPHKFRYIDLETVEKGILLKHNVISKDNAPSRAQRLLKDHDVLFQMVRPYQQNNLYFRSVENIPSVASTGYAQLRSFQSGRFLYYAIHAATFLGEVLNRCTGTNYPAINATDLSSLPLSLPSLVEQRKIAEFLSLIDERIEVEEKLLGKYEEQKQYLLRKMFV